MVHKGCHVLREHLRGVDLDPLRRVPVDVLGALRFVQPAVAILGPRALLLAVAPGARATGVLLAPLSHPAAERRHPGVCAAAHTLISLED
mmetsp:Transcript_125779/g.246509  ORF Transcript_125779/g.246509 Transcript_125779/m.246509 type:complete len:90 (-) Transcript_125779:212-481(-)